jgi:hypothetical protein
MPSPAVTRLDAAKTASSLSSSNPTGGIVASTNVTTSSNPVDNAVACAANKVSLDPTLATAPASDITNSASVIEGAKRLAAYAAVDQHILPHHKVCRFIMAQIVIDGTRSSVSVLVGIGLRNPRTLTSFTGSTVPYVVDRIIQQGKEANAGRVFIPTGQRIPLFRSLLNTYP